MLERPDIKLMLGDCRERLGEITDTSVDAVICDPPYPEISRLYGRMTEAEWHAMMRVVVPECRRVLKPTGSAVFILQPNYETPGRMRPWLWEFMAWTAREWNLVKDVYCWDFTALPLTKNDPNALRSSVRMCVWAGAPDCYHDVSGVRWAASEANHTLRMARRFRNHRTIPGGRCNIDNERMAAAIERNGGVTPFNLLPIQGRNRWTSGGRYGHPAATPLALMDWWIRYITPPGGVVCDPFMGSGTCGLAALKLGRSFIGIEQMPDYFATAERRLDALTVEPSLFPA